MGCWWKSTGPEYRLYVNYSIHLGGVYKYAAWAVGEWEHPFRPVLTTRVSSIIQNHLNNAQRIKAYIFLLSRWLSEKPLWEEFNDIYTPEIWILVASIDKNKNVLFSIIFIRFFPQPSKYLWEKPRRRKALKCRLNAMSRIYTNLFSFEYKIFRIWNRKTSFRKILTEF